ncbi:c-type cytochrome [Paracoccus thiocyanatus]|uniref:Cytochrome C n=1 Tax=Paracoccus thiocyanatus TaxID=34006 RepID=A0A3D8PEN5_9RHOB|nr:cytochrome C [Paracoccus thiocyanatus]RDW14530.1 cytochrome C [Paracoccus thiocyanatus]
MKISIYATLASLSLALPAMAQDAGDATKGEKEFNKCKACHMVQAPDGTDVVKGGKTGPNLYGVVGRKIASVEGFKYGDGILEVAEKNPDMVWTEEALVEYMTDPKPWLVEQTGDSAAKTKMTFKLGKNQADVAAFLAKHSPDAGAEAAPAEAEAN